MPQVFSRCLQTSTYLCGINDKINTYNGYGEAWTPAPPISMWILRSLEWIPRTTLILSVIAHNYLDTGTPWMNTRGSVHFNVIQTICIWIWSYLEWIPETALILSLTYHKELDMGISSMDTRGSVHCNLIPACFSTSNWRCGSVEWIRSGSNSLRGMNDNVNDASCILSMSTNLHLLMGN